MMLMFVKHETGNKHTKKNRRGYEKSPLLKEKTKYNIHVGDALNLKIINLTQKYKQHIYTHEEHIGKKRSITY